MTTSAFSNGNARLNGAAAPSAWMTPGLRGGFNPAPLLHCNVPPVPPAAALQAPAPAPTETSRGRWDEPAVGVPAHARWKNADALTVHTRDTIETAREATAAALTPARDMFVRNYLPGPAADHCRDPMRWAVEFDGVLVPMTMSLRDLFAFGTTTVTCLIQCAGNGRAFFADRPEGTPWSVGAAACASFTGVPLRLVVAGLGGGVEAPRFLTATGGEPLPDGAGEEHRVERSVPIEALRHAILAFAMNGEPLQTSHGGPLRLIVPGYYGVNHVKYVRRIALTRAESEAEIQTTGYRVRPVGVAPGPDQPNLWEMPVKSWIASAQLVGPRRVEVRGVAFGGTCAAVAVEITANGGTSWTQATFDGADMGPFAWRTFTAVIDLPRGTHTLASRAQRADGATQPENVPMNAQGFGHNGWRGHAVEVRVD